MSDPSHEALQTARRIADRIPGVDLSDDACIVTPDELVAALATAYYAGRTQGRRDAIDPHG